MAGRVALGPGSDRVHRHPGRARGAPLSLQRWVESRCPPEVTRAALDAEIDTLPPFWDDLGAQGHARASTSTRSSAARGPGWWSWPWRPRCWAGPPPPGPGGPRRWSAAVVAECGRPTLAKELLPGLVDGSLPATLALPTGDARRLGRVPRPGLTGWVAPDGGLHGVRARSAPCSTGPRSALVLAPVAADDGVHWVLVEPGPAVRVEPLPSFDPSRRSARWVLDGRRGAAGRVLARATTGRIRDLTLVVVSAEAAGGARWCLDTAAEHARTRHQFGRPIGQFQGVKHRLADMLVAVEQAVAATWDAALARPGTEARHGRRGRRRRRPRPGWPSSWPRPWPSTATWRRPRGPSRSSGAWASPGSTTPTSTCVGPPPCASSSAAPPRSGPRRPDWPWRAGDGA